MTTCNKLSATLYILLMYCYLWYIYNIINALCVFVHAVLCTLLYTNYFET